MFHKRSCCIQLIKVIPETCHGFYIRYQQSKYEFSFRGVTLFSDLLFLYLAPVIQWVRSLNLTAHTSLSPIRRGFAPSFLNYKNGALDSQPQVIKFTSCLLRVGGSLRVLRLALPLWYSWHIADSGVKIPKPQSINIVFIPQIRKMLAIICCSIWDEYISLA